MSRNTVFVSTLALVLLLAESGGGPGRAGATAAELTARAMAVPELKAVFGQVESRTVVPARARIGGTIRQIGVTEGSEVKEGQAIALVVDDKLALELNAAEAKIKELRSQLANARNELDRNQQLQTRGIVSQSRLDQMQTQFDVFANQVSAAEADKAVIAQKATEGAIVAPASGRVLTVPVTLGSVILAGEEVARIASGPYYLRLSLPERHAADIKEGDTVLIGQRGLSPARSGAMSTARPGRIAKIYPEISDGRVVADVEVAELGGYFVHERTLVWIPVGKRAVIALPLEAVTTRHGIDYVRVATPDGPLDVAVILGETFPHNGGTQVEILTGLRDGDRVVLPGSAK